MSDDICSSIGTKELNSTLFFAFTFTSFSGRDTGNIKGIEIPRYVAKEQLYNDRPYSSDKKKQWLL